MLAQAETKEQNGQLEVRDGVPIVYLYQLEQHLSAIAAKLYSYASNTVIGITGTNGKTSCAYWTAEIQNLLRKKTGVIGTLGFGYKKLKSHTYTTPDAISNHRILRQFKNKKVTS